MRLVLPTHDVSITGPNVRIVPFNETLITKEYIDWLNDMNLMKYSKQRMKQHTYETSVSYLKSFEGTPNQFWAVICLADNLCVGTLTTYVDPMNEVADVGILIGRDQARGKGLGREAWGMITDYLFRHNNVRKVTGGTLSGNIPMIKIMIGWHMILEGIRREQELIEGYPVDELLFGVLKRDWLHHFPNPVAKR